MPAFNWIAKLCVATAFLFPKAVLDGNAAALDKALEALVAFLAKATDKHVSRWGCPLKIMLPRCTKY